MAKQLVVSMFEKALGVKLVDKGTKKSSAKVTLRMSASEVSVRKQ